MPFCRKCGHEVDSDDKFCFECGAQLEPTVGTTTGRGKIKTPKKPPIEPLRTTKEVVLTPEKPSAKLQKETGKPRIAPAADTAPEAPKKAIKLRIRWILIPVAAVVVVAIGVATWWFAFSSPGKLIFEDNFSNPDSGWLAESGDWGRIAYSNGELAIQRKDASWARAINDNVGRLIDFAAEVDARKIPEGEDSTDRAILFRFQDNDNFYGFYVAANGKYSVWERADGKWIKLIGWTESDYAKTGTATNKLKVVCQGQKMDFYINGKKVDSAQDDTFSSGKIALAVTSTETTPSTEYFFDNFKVYAVKSPSEKISTGKLLFKDDFSSSGSGWNVSSADSGSVAYSNGELKMQRTTDGWKSTTTTNDNIDWQTDFIVEVDTRKIPEGEDGTDRAILFRFQDTNNFYGFYLSGNGKYSVWKLIDGKWTKLIDWTKSDYAKTGTATNKLKVVCQGQKMDFYINGHEVDSVNDSTFTEGTIALSMTSTESAPTGKYNFDNFRLYEIAPE